MTPHQRKIRARRRRDFWGYIGLGGLTLAMVTVWFYSLYAYLVTCGQYCS